MTERTLHPTPRLGDVVREQLRIVVQLLRREMLIVAAVAGMITLFIAIDMVGGRAGTWFETGEWLPLAILSFLLPFAVWWRDRRFGPSFLWTLPVDRRRLALARVFAGWVWLIATLGILVSWQRILAFLVRVENPHFVPPIAFTGVTAMYLFGSAIILGLRHPLRSLLGSGAALFVLGFVRDALDRQVDEYMDSSGLLAAIENAHARWLSLPPFLQWTLLTFVWVGVALIALAAAISRHKETR